MGLPHRLDLWAWAKAESSVQWRPPCCGRGCSLVEVGFESEQGEVEAVVEVDCGLVLGHFGYHISIFLLKYFSGNKRSGKT